MRMLEKPATQFLSELSSNAPVPGGGGASAAVGAFAAALGMMVTNLTIGKKKYADYEEEVKAVRDRLEGLRDQLIDLVDGDAVAFEPLSKAYSIPKDDPERDTIMENALYEASLKSSLQKAASSPSATLASVSSLLRLPLKAHL